jgi:hypothetical protein
MNLSITVQIFKYVFFYAHEKFMNFEHGWDIKRGTCLKFT